MQVVIKKMATRENLLSDSDSDDGSPAARPTTSRPKSKSAPPKSAKTVQAGRARAAVASDDGMDSDASDEARDDGALQTVMHQLTKQVFACPRSAPARTLAPPPCAMWSPTVSPSLPAAEDHDAEEG